ncbi:MAG: response regulator [Chitinophagaceae bacterium]|nr:MAG: response regulator [Chitinophagaceae bacterium]
MNPRKPIIYFVEDDADDRALLRQAFHRIPGCSLQLFASSEQFYRHMLSLDTEAQLPTLIVLDFNMPIINGGELLLRLKREEHLREIPVAVYSTGMLPILEETLRSYGASHCFVKATDYAGMEKMAQELLQLAALQSVAH